MDSTKNVQKLDSTKKCAKTGASIKTICKNTEDVKKKFFKHFLPSLIISAKSVKIITYSLFTIY